MRVNTLLVRWRQTLPLLVATVALTVLATLGVLALMDRLSAQSRHAEVATRGAQVMPFDLEQTMHAFQPTADGGVQTVRAKDATNNNQIALVQQHLQEEAVKFQQGDFTDPASIHGADMPGLATLQPSAERINVRYTPLPDGGQITFTTAEPTLITALHDWFAAQLSDHGQHATH